MIGGAIGLLVTGDPRSYSAQMKALINRPRTVGSGHFELCAWSHARDCVVDGDTFKLDGQIIRIADIDAPETHPPKCAAEAMIGVRAAERLGDWLNDGPFELNESGAGVDRYGRELRTVSRNGSSVGELLISEGLARSYAGRRGDWC